MPDGSRAAFDRASPNTANIARDTASCAYFHSGCHCTANAKAGAPVTLNASISPSAARALDREAAAEPVHALAVQ